MRHVLVSVAALSVLWSCAPPPPSGGPETATVIQTSRAGDRLRQLEPVTFSRTPSSSGRTIRLDPEKRYQEIVGFGGSFTESSASVLDQLSAAKRESVIDAYFSDSGAAYSLTRTHINSCDFSLDHYAYVDDGDEELETFSIDEDLDDLVPLIKDAMAAPGAEFKIIASPWSAPAWMKDNNSWYGGSLKPELQPVWAHYFSKYLEAYRDQGIEIWAITPENEPLGNNGQWDSMHFTPESMTEFIRVHLGPRLRADSWDTKILIYDQNRDHVDEWVDTILSDEQAASYVWGTAVHWYSSTVDWYPEVLSGLQERFPEKHILHSEGCIDSEVPVWRDDDWYWRKEATDWGYTWASEENKPKHPMYVPVYRYARDIIGGLNSWLVGWVDWNIVLDTQGGPNLAQNWCIAPVIANPETDEVYYTPLYDVLVHFSRYLRPGATRIEVNHDIEELMVTAVENPDGRIAVVVLNQGTVEQSFNLELNGQRVNLVIPAAAIQTILVG
jgi:glucosylceramidase